MTDERVVEDIITTFLLNTCRQRPQLSQPDVEAASYCALLATDHPVDDVETNFIPLITGSVAEFYIEPMIPHIGDVDVMRHLSTQLAIPRGHPPPTQLPDEFHNYVKVLEIIDSHLPGYVYLQLRYLLTECLDEHKYDRQMYLSNCVSPDATSDIHGPAVNAPLHIPSCSPRLSCDVVPCVRCLVWP